MAPHESGDTIEFVERPTVEFHGPGGRSLIRKKKPRQFPHSWFAKYLPVAEGVGRRVCRAALITFYEKKVQPQHS